MTPYIDRTDLKQSYAVKAVCDTKQFGRNTTQGYTKLYNMSLNGDRGMLFLKSNNWHTGDVVSTYKVVGWVRGYTPDPKYVTMQAMVRVGEWGWKYEDQGNGYPVYFDNIYRWKDTKYVVLDSMNGELDEFTYFETGEFMIAGNSQKKRIGIMLYTPRFNIANLVEIDGLDAIEFLQQCWLEYAGIRLLRKT